MKYLFLILILLFVSCGGTEESSSEVIVYHETALSEYARVDCVDNNDCENNERCYKVVDDSEVYGEPFLIRECLDHMCEAYHVDGENYYKTLDDICVKFAITH